MVSSALEYIQSESSTLEPSGTLPHQFQLNTESLLATLPSSTHFLLLPPNLRSYKPYVDPSSSSSCVSQTQLSHKLDEYFRKSIESLQTAIKSWFSDLRSATEVWNVRSSVLKWVNSASSLEEKEIHCLNSVFDSASRERLLSIWRSALREAGQDFEAQLSSAASALASEDMRQAGLLGILFCHPLSNLNYTLAADTPPLDYLFQASPPPALSQNSTSPLVADSSFQRYKTILQQQIMGRTPLLNGVLSTLENCARALQNDISRIISEEGDGNQYAVTSFLRTLY